MKLVSSVFFRVAANIFIYAILRKFFKTKKMETKPINKTESLELAKFFRKLKGRYISSYEGQQIFDCSKGRFLRIAEKLEIVDHSRTGHRRYDLDKIINSIN